MDVLLDIPSSDDVLDRRMVAHDSWPRRLLERRERRPISLPSRVFWPENDVQVSRLVQAARREHRALVPFGGGSGLCDAIAPRIDAWVVDMKRMNRVLEIDEVNHTCLVEVGIFGERLERMLNHAGYTLGHFPVSLSSSTVGGWLATRAAGQLSSRYGKIEDRVLAVWGIDGRGEHIGAAMDDPTTGSSALRLLLGSEGTLCIFTKVRLRLNKLPTHRWLRAFSVNDVDSGVSAMRSLMHAGESPSLLRFYDPLESAMQGWRPVVGGNKSDRYGDRYGDDAVGPAHVVAGGLARISMDETKSSSRMDDEASFFDTLAQRAYELAIFAKPTTTRKVVSEILGRPLIANNILDRWIKNSSVLLVGIEGESDDVAKRIQSISDRILQPHWGSTLRDLGDAPAETWLRQRYRAGYRSSPLFAAGSWSDGFEVATRWQQAGAVYRAIRDALRDVAITMCHISHAYRDGCSLYFTFAGGGSEGFGVRSATGRYELAWERALAVAKAQGAALSHQHGIGRSRARAFTSVGGAKTGLLALKKQLDPDGILNPGVLGLEAARLQGRA